MKKLTMLLLALVLLATYGMAEEQHVCAPCGLVDMDLNERWEVCQCGAGMNATAHAWTDGDWVDKVCSLCGALQILQEDGSVELRGVDEAGNITRHIIWDAEGEKIMNLATVYSYDEAGHVLSADYYRDDVRFSRSEFALDAEGSEYEIRSAIYEEDNSAYVCEYNERGDVVLEQFYVNGVLESALRYEYTRDEAGNPVLVQVYKGEHLVEETEYSTLQEGDSITHYVSRVSVFYPDGTGFTRIADAKGDTVSDFNTDAQGNVTSAYDYLYVYGEDGVLLRMEVSTEGKLVLTEEYALDADGTPYLAVETFHEADGTTIVTHYAPDGKVID